MVFRRVWSKQIENVRKNHIQYQVGIKHSKDGTCIHLKCSM